MANALLLIVAGVWLVLQAMAGGLAKRIVSWTPVGG